MSTNNLQSLKMLVAAGIGWSLLPETMLDDDLHVVQCDYQFSRQLGLVVHDKRSLSNAAEAMQKLLMAF
jgi:DNA-binding transcriptional LysR family regulator